MLAAALAICVLHPSAHPSNPRVATIVERAWEEQDKAEKAHQDDLARDRELGKKYSEQADKELKASSDKDQLARLQRIGAEMAEIANRTKVNSLWGDKRLNTFEYSFKLVEGKDVNAFSLPGGYIYFYDGLMKYAESDDEVAGVIAHEIAHASLRHVATLQREQEKLTRIQLPLILLAIFTGGATAAANTIGVTGLVGQATGSGWSQKAEEAADYAGFQYMVQSKYNPTAMLSFMERLAVDERNRPTIDWGIYRTHPPSRERANALLSYMEQAKIPPRRSIVTTTFRTTVKPGDDGTVQVLFGKRRLVSLAGDGALARADQMAEVLNAFFDTTPELYEISSGDDGLILLRRQPLLRLTKDDALAAKQDLPTLKAQTIRNMQASLFSLGFKIWDAG